MTLIARFILDIRGADSHNRTITPSELSTIEFVADLGAPVGQDSTWVTGQREDLDSDPGDLDSCFDESWELRRRQEENHGVESIL